MTAITYACPNCHQHGSHKENCPSWYEQPELRVTPDDHCPTDCHFGDHDESAAEEWRVSGKQTVHVVNGRYIATARDVATAAQIVSDHATPTLVPELVATLNLAEQLLTNQTICERSLCGGCNDVRQSVLETIRQVLARAANAAGKGGGR